MRIKVFINCIFLSFLILSCSSSEAVADEAAGMGEEVIMETIFSITHAGEEGDEFLVYYKSGKITLDTPGQCVQLKGKQFQDVKIADGTVWFPVICGKRGFKCEPGNYDLINDYSMKPSRYNNSDDCEALPLSEAVADEAAGMGEEVIMETIFSITHAGEEGDEFLVYYKSGKITLDTPGQCVQLKGKQFQDVKIADGTVWFPVICGKRGFKCEPGNYDLINDYSMKPSRYNNSDDCEALPLSEAVADEAAGMGEEVIMETIFSITHAGEEGDEFLVYYKSGKITLDTPGQCVQLKGKQFQDVKIADGTVWFPVICGKRGFKCEPGNYDLINDYSMKPSRYNNSDDCQKV